MTTIDQAASAIARRTVRFSRDDLALFAQASHDRNPLHLSDRYARTTPYAEPVAFGALAVLAGLGALPGSDPIELDRLFVEFRAPMHPDVTYRLEVESRPDGDFGIRFLDAGRVAMSATVAAHVGRVPDAPEVAGAPSEPGAGVRTEAADRAFADLAEGMAVSGSYAPDGVALDSLTREWGIAPGRLPGIQLAAILWSSYLIGMELPGRRALFWRADLRFAADGPGADEATRALTYRATVGGLDARFDAVRIDAEIGVAGRAFATAELRAFVRPLSPAPDWSPTTQPARPRLAGKVALVTGASRGLGAAIARELALAGATVHLNYLQADEEAQAVAASVPAANGEAGTIHLARGDATSPDWCEDLLASALPGRALDLLVCSASPPIRTLGFHPDGLDRFDEFVSRSVRLVSAPLATFLPGLAERRGQVVVISSGALETLPAEWPHYVTAKAAVEGLTEWAAAGHRTVRFTVPRPPKLLTDQMNTPGGRAGALPVEGVAARLVAALADDDGERTGTIRRLGPADLT